GASGNQDRARHHRSGSARCREGRVWALVADEGPAAMTEAANVRVKDLAQDLRTVDQAGSWPVEVGVAICDEDVPLTHRAQPIPNSIAFEDLHLALGHGDIKAARRDENDVRIGRRDLLPL